MGGGVMGMHVCGPDCLPSGCFSIACLPLFTSPANAAIAMLCKSILRASNSSCLFHFLLTNNVVSVLVCVSESSLAFTLAFPKYWDNNFLYSPPGNSPAFCKFSHNLLFLHHLLSLIFPHSWCLLPLLLYRLPQRATTSYFFHILYQFHPHYVDLSAVDYPKLSHRHYSQYLWNSANLLLLLYTQCTFTFTPTII